jgi:Ca2+-binding EF-hand superfamily protein
MDDDNDKEISLAEFTKAMKDFGCGLTDEETKLVFKTYDVDGSGALSIDEFVRGVRGEMNNTRKALVKVAFKILDKNGDGTLQVNDIKGVYNAKNHPDVKAGKKTEDEILGEFLETFEAHHNLRAQSKRDQTVTMEEFLEYYNNVSANIDNDKYFELMMVNSFKLWQYDAKYKEYAPANTGKGWSNTQKSSGGAPFGTSEGTNDWSTSNRPSTAKPKEEAKTVIKQGGAYTDENLMDLFRNKILSRGARGIIGLARLFKIIDDDNSKSLDLSEFTKACNDFRLDYSKEDIKRLFNMFDNNKNGDIDYDEFLRSVRGPMAPFRVKLVKQAFGKLDTDNSGTITLDEVRAKYNAKQHPDVKTGKKTEDEILMEFLDTFEIHHSIHTGDASSRDGTVTIAEFLEYYNNISSSIDDDKYFELMITNAWNLNNVSYQKGWKGEY